MKKIKPLSLNPGDKVGLVSPSGQILSRLDLLNKAIPYFEQATGLKTILAKYALGKSYYSSGTWQERTEDINTMFGDPEIKAVIFTIGGSTAIDIVDKIDYTLIKSNPKIFTGISDATTLLNSVYAKTGLITFLGIEFTDFGRERMEYEIEHIKKAWFKGKIREIQPNPGWRDFNNLPTRYKAWRTIKPGAASGNLIGGNSTSFIQLIGTAYCPRLKNNILLFETHKLKKREIHRQLMRLRLIGVFDKISGLIIGYCLGSDDPEIVGNERDIKDILLETTKDYSFPIMEIGEIGHNVENIIIPIGAKASIDATSLKFTIDEKVTR